MWNDLPYVWNLKTKDAEKPSVLASLVASIKSLPQVNCGRETQARPRSVSGQREETQAEVS